MESSGDKELSNKVGLGDDHFVDKLTEFDDREQSASRRTTDRRKPQPPRKDVFFSGSRKQNRTQKKKYVS